MKVYLFVISLFYSLLIYGQDLSGVIKYRFKYSYTVQASNPTTTTIGTPVNSYDLPAYLYFNTQKSLFDYDKLEYNTSEPPMPKRKCDEYGQMYFIDKVRKELYIREFIYGKPYITHEPIPTILWQLTNEVKTIAGYVCKKATAEFRGRKYTAWYTSSIPVSIGPWKLQGLPGAILEAHSEDGEVSFETESIRIPAYVESKLNIQTIPEGKVVTYQEYLSAFEKERKTWEESSYTFLMNFFQEQKEQNKIKEVPKKETMKVDIAKIFTIEKYE